MLLCFEVLVVLCICVYRLLLYLTLIVLEVYMWSTCINPDVFWWVPVTQSLIFYVVICRSLCVICDLFFQQLYCRVLDLYLLITLISSNFFLYWLVSCRNPRLNLQDQTGIWLTYCFSVGSVIVSNSLILLLISSYVIVTSSTLSTPRTDRNNIRYEL